MVCSLRHPGATHPTTGKSITTSPFTTHCTSTYDVGPPRSLRDEHTTSSNPPAFSFRATWPANSHRTPVPSPFTPATNFTTARKAFYGIHEAFEILQLAIQQAATRPALSFRAPWPANSHLTPVPSPFTPATNFSTA